MELKADYEIGIGIVVRLDQPIVGVGHGLKSLRQAADALVMVTVHHNVFAAVPARQRGCRNDLYRVAIGIVVLIVDVVAIGALFFLHIAVESSAARGVHQLRSAADAQDGNFALECFTQEAQLDVVFERVGLLKKLKVRLAGGVAMRLNVFAFDQQ